MKKKLGFFRVCFGPVALMLAFALLLSVMVVSVGNEGHAAQPRPGEPVPEAFLAIARAAVAEVPAEQREAVAQKLAEILAQEFKDVATLYDVAQNRPWEFVQRLLKHEHEYKIAIAKAFQVKEAALAVLAGTGIPDATITSIVGKVIGDPANRGSIDGPKLFDAVAKDLRDNQKVNWADDLIGARIIDAYLAAKAGKELTVSEIRKMEEQAFNNLVQQVAGTVGVPITAVLHEAYQRVKNSWLPFLERKIELLTSQLMDLNQQLDAMKQEVTAMKQRTDPLPLSLAIVALILAAGSVLLALRKRRRGES
jgi:hypothetical protein